MSLLVENERDRLALAWLKGRVGDHGIERGLHLLVGDRKPYVSNVAKALGLEIPKDLYTAASPDVARENLAKIRAILKKG